MGSDARPYASAPHNDHKHAALTPWGSIAMVRWLSTRGNFLAADPDFAGRVLEDVGHRAAEVELAEFPAIRDSQHDEIDVSLDCLFHDRCADVPCLQDLSLNL